MNAWHVLLTAVIMALVYVNRDLRRRFAAASADAHALSRTMQPSQAEQHLLDEARSERTHAAIDQVVVYAAIASLLALLCEALGNWWVMALIAPITFYLYVAPLRSRHIDQ